ncbi:serine/threonine-protein kinase [Mycobacterium angelicum]|uniref:non-specific serine/threonine protein kinase n=1 Tax=Mycobacterium angelicum TaxID=470074 RepID=A0A1W9ZHZ0_MYCAN|nr:serine/threonine-protein kinase [Mycobacterium angelicum]MCV7195982.1 protein kinase [Mycobacterium angelicum]ORA15751.1 serine/threonine protein kinase [Mycobacterium angelicum]
MSEASDSRVGSMFGPYHLKRLLGRGGMGEVYEAEHTVKEWTVAVKLMTAEFSKDPVFRERMKREARIAGRLQEPHVVPIHDYGEIDGQMYLEMRMIEGTDLDSVLKRFGPLTPPRAVAIITQIASALDAAHAAGVMHRDVKPPNILVTREDFAYLVDFGIASATTDEKLTQLGTAVGTWKYMAPERFSNDEVTYRADIYALACVLYECLTGSPPYRADSATTLVTAHLMDPVPQVSAARSGIPKSFDAVIARGMAKKPEERYASAGDLARAAKEALSDPDQDHAEDILRRSRESTMLGTGLAEQPPTVAAGTPPPGPAPAPPPPPYGDPLSSGPMQRPAPAGQPQWSSGPVPAAAPTPQYFQGSSWGGTPPGTPPPQQPGGPWSQSPAPRKRNPWPIVAGAAAAVVVLVLAGIGIWIATQPDDKQPIADNSSTPVTTPSSSKPLSTPPTSTTPADPQSRLLSFLPAGYSSGTCTATTPKPNSVWTGAVAMVDCGQNSNQGGPSRAVYGLFPSLDALKQAFNDDIGAGELSNCPGEGPSPDTWHYAKSPNVVAGMIACGTYKNHPNVIWSNESKLMLSDVFGDPATLEDLHSWWAKYG